MKTLAFNIQTSEEYSGSTESPAPIATASVVYKDTRGFQVVNFHGEIGKAMVEPEAVKFLNFLNLKKGEGYSIFSWNGASFHFPMLFAATNRLPSVKELCRGHQDIMFHLLAHKGYGISLDAVALQMFPKKEAVLSKLKTVDFPKSWKDVNSTEDPIYDELMDLSALRAKLVWGIGNLISTGKSKNIQWLSRSGRDMWLNITDAKLFTVDEAYVFEGGDDTSWMGGNPDDPEENQWHKDNFAGWLFDPTIDQGSEPDDPGTADDELLPW